MQDILTDNNNNLIITKDDISLKDGTSCLLLALRNFLNENKYLISVSSIQAINALILSKCLSLGLDITNIVYDAEQIKKGVLNITTKVNLK